MRLIDADALIEDLEYDVELDARKLDDMDFVGVGRDNIQFDKDCKQNAIDLLLHATTIEERKTGKWVLIHPLQEDDEGAYICSCCKSGSWEVLPSTWKACPWCGATMEGSEPDGND